jgi:hypothetical protein
MNTEFNPLVLAIIQAGFLAMIGQAIVSGFNPVQIIWRSIQNVIVQNDSSKTAKPVPIILVPLVCGPCFSFWSTLITMYLNHIWIGHLAAIGMASFAFLFSKLIHILTNRK